MKKFFGAAVLAAAIAIPAIAYVGGGGVDSGLKVGEAVSAFHPTHIAGPHKGTDACPPCTYGMAPQVQVWVNGDDAANVEKITKVLNDRVGDWNKSKLKTFVIFLTDNPKQTEAQISKLAEKGNFKNVALALLSKNDEAVRNYKVNTSVDMKNTVFVYKNREVQSKFVNLKADEKGLLALNNAISGIAK